MAMLTKSTGLIQTGNRNEVCIVCAIKAGKRHIDARREDKGALEGKPVFRIDSERCICLECMKELSSEPEQEDKGVTV